MAEAGNQVAAPVVTEADRAAASAFVRSIIQRAFLAVVGLAAIASVVATLTVEPLLGTAPLWQQALAEAAVILVVAPHRDLGDVDPSGDTKGHDDPERDARARACAARRLDAGATSMRGSGEPSSSPSRNGMRWTSWHGRSTSSRRAVRSSCCWRLTERRASPAPSHGPPSRMLPVARCRLPTPAPRRVARRR